jgi:putative chitinase
MKAFFETIRPLFGNSFTQKQVDGLNVLLKATEGMTLSDRAYILATAFHETDKTMQPIEEYGRGKGKKYGAPDAATGKVYYGRGYVQLTWKSNYKFAGEKLGVGDAFVNRPELVMEPATAAKIIVRGMQEGWFTGRKMSDFVSYRDKRRVVNAMDCADLIAGHAAKFERALVLMGTEAANQASTAPSAPPATPIATTPEKPALGPPNVPASQSEKEIPMNWQNATSSISLIIIVLSNILTAFGCHEAAAAVVASCSIPFLSPELNQVVTVIFSLLGTISQAMKPGGVANSLFKPAVIVLPEDKAGVGSVTKAQVMEP